MAGLVSWLNGNWLSLLQGVGIVFGLCFTALSIRQDTKARRTSDLLALTQQHRELWGEMHKRPDLHRISKPELDLVAAPPTDAEEEFLNLVFVHFHVGWLLARAGALAILPLSALRVDVRSFFDLPLPRSVWREAKKSRDPEFVAFVDECLKARS